MKVDESLSVGQAARNGLVTGGESQVVSQCPYNISIACFLDYLQQSIATHGSITIRHGDTGRRLGWLDRRTNTINLRHDLDPTAWRSALVHELEHLNHPEDDREHVAAEEARVRQATARRLLPIVTAIAERVDINHGLTAAAAEQIAEDAAVHIAVARDAIDPPTIPLVVVVPAVDEGASVA